METERDIVRKKFADIINHLGSLEGIDAISEHLPPFIASLLVGVGDTAGEREEVLLSLCADVLANLGLVEHYETATRQ